MLDVPHTGRHAGLPRSKSLYVQVTVLCRYDFFLSSPLLGGTTQETEFDWGGCKVFVSKCVVEGLQCYFIEPGNRMFGRDAVYGWNDDAARFEFFSKVRQFGTCCPSEG